MFGSVSSPLLKYNKWVFDFASQSSIAITMNKKGFDLLHIAIHWFQYFNTAQMFLYETIFIFILEMISSFPVDMHFHRPTLPC